MLSLLPLAGWAVEIVATVDTFTRELRPDRNYGDEDRLRVTGTDIRTGFVFFDVSDVSGVVTSATVSLQLVKSSGPGTIAVHALEAPWVESTVTAATAPPMSPVAVTTLQIDGSDEQVTADISGIVQTWVDDPTSNFGIALVPMEGGYHFDSTEGTQGPTLELNAVQGALPAGSTTSNDATRTVLLPVADSYTIESQPDRNLGDQTRVVTSRPANQTGFYDFDFSNLSGANVNTATLVVPIADVRQAGIVNVHRVLAPWEEATITAGNEPVVDASPETSFNVTVADDGATVKLDLTSLVQDWVADENTSFGLAFVPLGVRMYTYSKESAYAPVSIEVLADPVEGPTVSGVIDRSGEEEPESPDDVPAGPSGTPPQIAGAPDPTVTVGEAYRFQPNATDAEGDPLTFMITNKPDWMQFDPATGLLAGTPSSAQVGIYEGIAIGVSDGQFTDSLPAFDLSVNDPILLSYTLAWQPPVNNEDGSPLTDLAGFKIRYGPDVDEYPFVIDIANPGITAYFLDGLLPGPYYFVVTAYNKDLIESEASNALFVLLN